MSKVIEFPVDTTKVELTEAQEEVVSKIKEMLDHDENWMIEYHTENEDCAHAEYAVECAETDFDVIVKKLSQEIDLHLPYDKSLFDYLAGTLSSDKQVDFVDFIHANADLVHISGWGEPYGVSLGYCTVGEVESQIREEILDLAEANNIDLEHETFSQYCIKGDYMYVEMNYDTWHFRLDDDKYEDVIEYLKELNERRD